MSNELVKLALDVYRGTVDTQFSKEQAEEALRKSLQEMAGVDGSGKFDYYKFQVKAPEVFALIAEILDEIIPATVEEQFGDFAEVKSYGWGDKPVFDIPVNPNDRLYDIAVISEGNNNLLRQKISDNGQMTVSTYWQGVKIYEDFMKFLAGKTNWAGMIADVSRSWNRKMSIDIYNTFIATYTTIGSPYKGTGTFNADALAEIIQHVEAATQQEAVIIGTKLGLGKVGPSADMLSNEMKNDFNQLGRYGQFRGTTMRELKQSHVQHTDTFALDDKSILILPTGGVKPIKIVTEGVSLINATNGTESSDGRMEYTFRKKVGIATIHTVKYGMWQLP